MRRNGRRVGENSDEEVLGRKMEHGERSVRKCVARRLSWMISVVPNKWIVVKLSLVVKISFEAAYSSSKRPSPSSASATQAMAGVAEPVCPSCTVLSIMLYHPIVSVPCTD